MGEMTLEAVKNFSRLFSARIRDQIKNLGRCPVCRQDDILEVIVNDKVIANCPTCQEKERNHELNTKMERQRRRLIELRDMEINAAKVAKEMDDSRKRIEMENNFMNNVGKNKSHYDTRR